MSRIVSLMFSGDVLRGKGTGLFRFGAVNVLNKCLFPSSYFSFVPSLREEKKLNQKLRRKKIHFFTLQQVGNMNIYRKTS